MKARRNTIRTSGASEIHRRTTQKTIKQYLDSWLVAWSLAGGKAAHNDLQTAKKTEIN
jgi:hypothetical protein